MSRLITNENIFPFTSNFKNISFFTFEMEDDESRHFVAILNKITIVLLYMEMVFCFLFNIISLCGILFTRPITSIKLLIINLAIADLLYACGIPFYARQFSETQLSQSLFGCRVSFLLDVTCMIVIVFTIAALTLERYFCLKENKLIDSDSRNFRVVLIYVVSLWLLAILFSLPKTMSVILVSHNGLTSCGSSLELKQEQIYTISKWIFAFAFPYLFIITFSSLLLRFLKEWSKKSENLHQGEIKASRSNLHVNINTSLNEVCKILETNNSKSSSVKSKEEPVPSENRVTCCGLACLFKDNRMATNVLVMNHSKILSIKKRSVKLVLAVVFSFMCCWSPLWIFQIIIIFTKDDSSTLWLQIFLNITNVLVYLGGVINPLVYMLLTKNFREFLIKKLRYFKRNN